MSLRPHVVLAIARRDLNSQLRGRRGWVLPVITAVLLAPLAATPLPSFTPPAPTGAIAVTGDVPDEVAALPTTAVVPDQGLRFVRSDDHLTIAGPGVPDDIRAALDADDEGKPVAMVSRPPWPLPGRTLILALLASSILTGAVSESLPGERSRKTLEALLTAAVSRSEVVVGKWLAWAGFGAVAASAAGLLAVLTGTMPPGWWMVVLPAVPMGTVALGLYLVRRARDVVGGATVSLRVLPAVLSILGIVAWFVGLSWPEIGALVPLGGALVAAGGTWVGPAAPLLALGLTLAGTALLLWLTARDLEQSNRPMAAIRLGTELWSAAWVAGAWWLGLGAAAAWTAAGNPVVSRELATWPALAAASAGVFAVMAVRAAREVEPLTLLGLRERAPWAAWAAAPVAALFAVAAWWLPGLSTTNPTLAFLVERAAEGAWPSSEALAAGLLAVCVQELVFRGWLQRSLGALPAGLLFVLIICPFDPLTGASIALILGALTRAAKGSVWPALIARLAATATMMLVTA